MSEFEKITQIVLYDLEKVLHLCEGDTIIARYEVTESEDAFAEGHTSKWTLKEFKEVA